MTHTATAPSTFFFFPFPFYIQVQNTKGPNAGGSIECMDDRDDGIVGDRHRWIYVTHMIDVSYYLYWYDIAFLDRQLTLVFISKDQLRGGVSIGYYLDR